MHNIIIRPGAIVLRTPTNDERRTAYVERRKPHGLCKPENRLLSRVFAGAIIQTRLKRGYTNRIAILAGLGIR